MHYEICCKPPASAICICEIMAFAEVRNHTEPHKWKAYVHCVCMLDGSGPGWCGVVCTEFPLGFLSLFPRCSRLPLQGRYVLAFVSVEISCY